MLNLLVLMTTHNNEKQCLESISHLSLACDKAGVNATLYLANSGVHPINVDSKFNNVSVREFPTSDDTYWAIGMRQAWELAVEEGGVYEFVLWLNDDTLLSEGSLTSLLSVLEGRDNNSIVVGTCSNDQQVMTYGGLKQKNSLFRLHLMPTPPSDTPSKCDTFNGNLVLLRYRRLRELGGFPDGFTHLRADIHFGLTNRARGGSNLVSPGIHATCEKNDAYKGYKDLRILSIKKRIIELNDPKFGPIKEHVKFSLRHGGALGIGYAVAPLVRALIGR